MVVSFPLFTTSLRKISPRQSKWSYFTNFVNNPKMKTIWSYVGWYGGAFISIGGGLATADRLIIYWTGAATVDEKVDKVKLDTTAILQEIRGHRSETMSSLQWLRAYHERLAAGAAAGSAKGAGAGAAAAGGGAPEPGSAAAK